MRLSKGLAVASAAALLVAGLTACADDGSYGYSGGTCPSPYRTTGAVTPGQQPTARRTVVTPPKKPATAPRKTLRK